MTDQAPKELNINLIELVNISANILHQLFVSAPKDKSREIFKTIKQGKAFNTGTLKLGEFGESSLKLSLDYSDFQGPGFNYDVFSQALQALLKRLSIKLQRKEDLNVLSSDKGSVVVTIPGLVQVQEQVNILMISLDFANPREITLCLMFIDPSQFEERENVAGE